MTTSERVRGAPSVTTRAILVATVFAYGAAAQVSRPGFEFSASPSPVGSGARAAGMANAFVAIADDATAASWNPAGLIQLELPEFSAVGASVHVFESLQADYHDEFDRREETHNLDLNFLSFTYPFVIGDRNVVAGLYYQQKWDFTRDVGFQFNASQTLSPGLAQSSYTNVQFRQRGDLSTITPAFAIELTNRLSIGVGLNIWQSTFLSENGWEQTISNRQFLHQGANLINPFYVRRVETVEDVEGLSWTAGILWNITDRWSVGARYDSAWTADATMKRRLFTADLRLPLTQGQNPLRLSYERSKESLDIRFPATIAVGVAHRFENDRDTISFDVSRTDWNDFWFRGDDGQRISLVNQQSFDAPFNSPDFDPTYTFRLGYEHVFIPRTPRVDLNRLWSIRAGIFYDQEPASDEPDDFFGISFGAGLLANQRVNLDVACELRYGREVNEDFTIGVPGFREDVLQARVLFSTVIYLNRGRQ